MRIFRLSWPNAQLRGLITSLPQNGAKAIQVFYKVTENYSPEELQLLRELLGYLNFSNGTPDAAFQSNFNTFCQSLGENRSASELRGKLHAALAFLQNDSPVFADSQQAERIVELLFDDCLPAYKIHHSDLLFHLDDSEFEHPFFLVRMIEAILLAGPPWDEVSRIQERVLDQLNDYIGYRPLATLENERRSEPYSHERFRPVPLYLRGAGAAAGQYQLLIEHTIDFFKNTPADVLGQSYFDLECMDELAIDVRAYDHLHPVNKRTNYTFGEWDPHLIDNRGFYRRFIVRKVILDALLKWIDESDQPFEETMFDASAVLCGTMLMASSISGSGPDAISGMVSLSSLLPRVARQRDAFYARLLDSATGERRQRLFEAAERTQQPFGHVRQYLNIDLARLGAKQVQYRFVAQLYARMGFADAARKTAAIIPTASARFECEISCRLTQGKQYLTQGRLDDAIKEIDNIEELIQRGIRCGALIDPWNILGFQGLFPLFPSREDSIPDHRTETLMRLMERLFSLYSLALAELSAEGNDEAKEQLSRRYRASAENWDQYATYIVADLPEVFGQESWESANNVAEALSEWRQADEATGDISFWRQHVDQFESAQAYVAVVDTLLKKGDHIASMGLLMQWLSEAEEMGIEASSHSIYGLFIRWIELVINTDQAGSTPEQRWPIIQKLFDYLEANAGIYWSAPRLEEFTDDDFEVTLDDLINDDVDGDDDDEPDEESLSDDDEDNLFNAAYDNVVYRDSAEDGHENELMDGAEAAPGTTEFEMMARWFEPRLHFISMVAQLWQSVSVAYAPLLLKLLEESKDDAGELTETHKQQLEVIRSWSERAEYFKNGLMSLLKSVWAKNVAAPLADPDANIENDLQIQTKYYLLHSIIVTMQSCQNAQRCLDSCTVDLKQTKPAEDDLDQAILGVYQGLFRSDVRQVRAFFPDLLKQLAPKPLLYVPFDKGGTPLSILQAQTLQTAIRFLLAQLTRAGMLRETWQLLLVAYRMERSASRPRRLVVTEFDRLFRIALSNSLETIIVSSSKWKNGKFSDQELVETMNEVLEHYQTLWINHSGTMRLSMVESLKVESVWEDVQDFIRKYGDDLFHTRMLVLGHVRTLLHTGIDEFLDYLKENQDPLKPVRLIDDLNDGVIEYEHAKELLELIYEIVVDRFERFMEYNTTTTQSDYGEKFYCLLAFLRVEASYERENWKLMPVILAHETLTRLGRNDAARLWEESLEKRTRDNAIKYVEQLTDLEQQHGMQLPSLLDRLNERFVKPLAVNRMRSLVPRAMDDAETNNDVASEAFEKLSSEIDDYLNTTAGSGIDIPPWLRRLEEEVRSKIGDNDAQQTSTESTIRLPHIPLSLKDLKQQLRNWNQRVNKPRKPPSV